MTNKLKRKLISAIFLTSLVSVGFCQEVFSRPAGVNGGIDITELKGLKIPNGNSKVTLSFRDTDVKQILRMFADKAGLNIVFQGDIKGTVTMDLVDTTLSDAFDYIMEASKLTFFIRKNTLIVMSVETAKTSSFSKNDMRIIPIKYTNASSIANFLNKNIFNLGKPGLSTGDIAVTDSLENSVILFGSDADYEMAKQIIAKLDVKPVTTTYKINHVTPKEMATLVCDSLFSAKADANSSKFAGTFTGAAAGEALEIGTNKIACQITNKPATAGLSSFSSVPITVMYNSGLGTISLLGGSKEQIQMLNEFITLNDKKQPQAILDLVLLSLNESGSQTFQNNWVLNNGSFPISFSGGATDGALTLGKIIFIGNKTQGTGAQLLYDAITWVEKTGKGRLLQKPKIIITNGAESVIDMTQDYIEKTDSTISTGTISSNPITERTYTIGKDQGLKMTVQPFISRDGYVTLNIKADYSNPYHTETLKDELDNEYIAVTLLERRNFTLNSVRVKNGETLVIGGLIYESEIQNVSKIPILGDIPGLGVFFRNTSNTKSKNELVVFITPRLLDDTDELVDL